MDTVADDAWDMIAGGFADINPEQTACYATHHWKGRDSHLLLRRDGEPVAGARIAVVSLPLVGRGLAFLPFGPFWRRTNTEADAEIYRTVISALTGEYCMSRGLCLTILPRPHPDYHALECGWLRGLGFTQRREFEDAERYLVNTALDEEAQRKSFSRRWRCNLRQSHNHEIDIRMTGDPEEIRAFQDLYASIWNASSFPVPHPSISPQN